MKSYDSLLDGDVELQKEIQELVQRRAEEEIQKGLQRETEKLHREAEKEAERIQKEAENSIIAEQQQTVLYVVEARFPTLLDVARQNVPFIRGRSELSQLAKQIMRAPDEKIALWSLESFIA